VEPIEPPAESPSWDALIPRYREYLESGTLSPRTVDLRLYHLNRIRKFVNKRPGDVLLEDLTRYFQGRAWACRPERGRA
jgi:hypothetical protein